MSKIVNKVQQSRLETIDLEKLIENEAIGVLDIRPFLFQDMILREKEFRAHLEAHNWKQYKGVWLGVMCSVDALIPSWAWMLVATHAAPYALGIFYGDESSVRRDLLRNRLESIDWEGYRDKFVLLKGCSKMEVPPDIYLEATNKLIPIASKVMYGEACSNVPVFRDKKG